MRVSATLSGQPTRNPTWLPRGESAHSRNPSFGDYGYRHGAAVLRRCIATTGVSQFSPIADTRAATFENQVIQNVAKGATVYTDEHTSYRNLGDWYEHQSVAHSAREFVNGMATTNGIESVWAVIKRGYNGVYHQWTPKHMARYINEFTFRLNEGNVRIHTMRRIDSLIDGAVGKRLTYRRLIAD